MYGRGKAMDNNGSKLLIVDGAPLTVDLISNWLRDEEVQIFTAESGLNALAKLHFIKPDILIINVELPDMSGFDLCRRVKSEMENSLVLCISALESNHNRLRAEEMRADDYFETHAEHHLFISKVRSLLRVGRLSKQLHQKYAELEEKNAHLSLQLEMGIQVQRAFIPEVNMNFKHCALLSRYYPAMGVGGDFYQVLPLTPYTFGIVMGDVSGYGIAAAFCTALLTMMIKNLSITYAEPDQLLFHLNNEMFKLFEASESPLYACVFYALIDTSSHTVYYANAGQCLPFYVAAKENTVQELELSGYPVGMMNESEYEMKSLAYQPSDLLLFHTDGLMNSFFKDQPDEFAHRMQEVLSGIRNITSLSDMLDILRDNFCDTTADGAKHEADDVSMILCRL
jgi:sigma-B regulation protein RsbU (phosphoserine phosphatase)